MAQETPIKFCSDVLGVLVTSFLVFVRINPIIRLHVFKYRYLLFARQII